MTPLELNACEFTIIFLAVALVYLVLAVRDRRWVRNALLVLCIVPALFLAVEGGTEVLTWDETYMVRETTNLRNVSSRQWNFANYRTSMAVTNTSAVK